MAKTSQTTRPMKKLDNKWLGPYLVEKVISRSAYKLKLPSSFGQLTQYVSVMLLRPYSTDTIANMYNEIPSTCD